jgi:hypothetical protein
LLSSPDAAVRAVRRQPGRRPGRLSRQVGRTLPQRLGVDLVLVALAVIGLWQLRLYGSPLTANAAGCWASTRC